MKKRISFFLVVLVLFSCFLGCENENIDIQTKTYYDLFDSFAEISSYSGDSKQAFEENCKYVEEKLVYYDKIFDIYNEYKGINNLCTVNKEAGVKPVKVDKELIDFLEYAIELCKKCGLEVNIAMGSVLKLWHDARTSANEQNKPYLPSKIDLEDAYKHSNIDSIVIDRENSTIFISDPLTQIDVGAIAKGYAAMRVAEILKSRGANGYVINLGGNIVAIGTKKNGDAWVTGITNPDKNSSEKFAARIKISNTSCVTSGDYERYFSFNGKNYHHIIDKDTLEPSTHFRSVTVIARDSATADTLSTALFCMSIEDGRELLKTFDGVEALWILFDGSIVKTPGVKLLAQ